MSDGLWRVTILRDGRALRAADAIGLLQAPAGSPAKPQVMDGHVERL